MKTWSYKEITERTENEIQQLMEQSRTAKDKFEERLFRDWAYGVFIGWRNLTSGWMNDGDFERLESLTNHKGA